MSSEKDVAKTIIFHIKMMQVATPGQRHIDKTQLFRQIISLGYSRGDYLDGWVFAFSNEWIVRDGPGFVLTDLGRLQSP
jgi:hypothetical protein